MIDENLIIAKIGVSNFFSLCCMVQQFCGAVGAVYLQDTVRETLRRLDSDPSTLCRRKEASSASAPRSTTSGWETPAWFCLISFPLSDSAGERRSAHSSSDCCGRPVIEDYRVGKDRSLTGVVEDGSPCLGFCDSMLQGSRRRLLSRQVPSPVSRERTEGVPENPIPPDDDAADYIPRSNLGSVGVGRSQRTDLARERPDAAESKKHLTKLRELRVERSASKIKRLRQRSSLRAACLRRALSIGRADGYAAEAWTVQRRSADNFQTQQPCQGRTRRAGCSDVVCIADSLLLTASRCTMCSTSLGRSEGAHRPGK